MMGLESVVKMDFIDFLVQIKILSSEASVAIKELSEDDQLLKFEEKGIDLVWLEDIRHKFDTIPYVDLHSFVADTENFSQTLSEQDSRRLGCCLLAEEEGKLRVGMLNPFDQYAVEALTTMFNHFIEPVLIDFSGLNSLYTSSRFIEDKQLDEIISRLGVELKDHDTQEIDLHGNEDKAISTSASVQLLEHLIVDAYHHGVSDIHVELENTHLRIRRRVDGVLIQHVIRQGYIAGHIFRRLRIMANLDIASTMLPQDGRISVKHQGYVISCRLSIVSTNSGQSAVIRLLGDVEAYSNLSRVLDDKSVITSVRNFLKKHSGMMLVTGPTGSGKTTTQYCALMEINHENRKIISLEDPVEANLDGVNQIQINEDLGASFPVMLSAILRQDPDAIMIGEVRDQQTANIAMRAAITGHLVLATLHTSDVMTTINRLMNLDVPGYMVASALRLILSQRLIKKICKHCKTQMQLNEYEQSRLDLIDIPKERLNSIIFYKGEGCQYCQNTGYYSRCAVIEYLICDEHLMDVLTTGDYVGFKLLAEEKMKGQTLAYKAIDLLEMGEIPIDQAIQFIGE